MSWLFAKHISMAKKKQQKQKHKSAYNNVPPPLKKKALKNSAIKNKKSFPKHRVDTILNSDTGRYHLVVSSS